MLPASVFVFAHRADRRGRALGDPEKHRSLCRPILETYRKLLRYAELQGATALSVRHTVVLRLCHRGADEEQIGSVSGIAERNAVREVFLRSGHYGCIAN